MHEIRKHRGIVDDDDVCDEGREKFCLFFSVSIEFGSTLIFHPSDLDWLVHVGS